MVAAQKHGFRQPSLQRILLLLGLLVEIRMVLVVPLLSSGKSTNETMSGLALVLLLKRTE